MEMMKALDIGREAAPVFLSYMHLTGQKTSGQALIFRDDYNVI